LFGLKVIIESLFETVYAGQESFSFLTY